MNYKKLIAATVGAAFAGSLGDWSNATLHGVHVAVTFGNLVLPAVTALIPTLLALFAAPPHKE